MYKSVRHTVTTVHLESSPRYISHVRTIIACLADSAAMGRNEAERLSSALSGACEHAIRGPRKTGERLSIVLQVRSRRRSRGTSAFDRRNRRRRIYWRLGLSHAAGVA